MLDVSDTQLAKVIGITRGLSLSRMWWQDLVSVI